MLSFAAAIDETTSWSQMSPQGWIQAVGALLILMMVWLVKSSIEIQINMLKDIKSEGELDRKLIRDECSLVRQDHRADMLILFDDNKQNRIAVENGLNKVTDAIRDVKQGMTTQHRSDHRAGGGQ